ncbi:MAG TPA: hypothetical protein VK390_07460, partial [Propionibacteriaceae bacterium]|nr:hypothetical protein [Propionibacteriaceae bacterium]
SSPCLLDHLSDTTAGESDAYHQPSLWVQRSQTSEMASMPEAVRTGRQTFSTAHGTVLELSGRPSAG